MYPWHAYYVEYVKMSDRKFIRILIIIILIGIIITAAHSIYICYAYQHSSIIQFIAKELWP